LRPQTFISDFTHVICLRVDEGFASTCEILETDLIFKSLSKLFLLKWNARIQIVISEHTESDHLLDPGFELGVLASLMKPIFLELVHPREAEYRVTVQLSRLGWYNKEAKIALKKWMDKL
jgi:PleD family two-component response regulator